MLQRKLLLLQRKLLLLQSKFLLLQRKVLLLQRELLLLQVLETWCTTRMYVQLQVELLGKMLRARKEEVTKQTSEVPCTLHF